MDELGLFPLGIALLPTEQMPLHIFEERYQELIGECLEQETEFGLVFADDDGLREIGTRAAVVEVIERFDDGRLNVLVEGRERFRLLEVTSGRSFHTGRVEPVADGSDVARPADVDRALGLFRRLAELTRTDVDEPEQGEPQLSFLIAARFDFAAPLKQELLQETSERTRMQSLCRLLEIAAAAVERQQEIAARAQTNGRVQPGPDDD